MFKKSICVFSIVMLTAITGFAQVPKLINYQGRLTDSGGTPITGTLSMELKIYNTASGSSHLWTESQSVVVTDGDFNILLGSVTPIQYSVFNGGDKYLGIKVGADPEMTPRKRLVSVGYAFQADNADNVDGKDASDFVHTGQANSVSSGMIQSNAVTKEKVTPDFVSSVDGVKNDGGNIDLVAGSNVTITPDDANNKITISASGGGSGDNLGNHTATQNVKLNNKWLSNDGGNKGLKIDNMGNIDTNNDLTVDNDIEAAGYIASNEDIIAKTGHIRTGSSQPITLANGDIFAANNLISYNGYIRLGTPTSSYGQGDIASTDDIVADDDILGHGTIYGYGNNNDHAIYGTKNSNFGYVGHENQGVYGKHVNGPYGMLGTANYGVWGQKGTTCYGNLGGTYGVYGYRSSGYAAYFVGNARVTGTLSKGGGSFTIDHPLDPANKYLQHSFVESPDMMNIYNGNATLDANGEAEIVLPEWFNALNKDFRYQLTAIGKPGPNLYVAETISNNSFKVAGGSAGMDVSWQVTGIRKDAFANANRIQVELEKTGDEKGKFIHPKANGVDESLGIEYEFHKQVEKQNNLIEQYKLNNEQNQE